MRIDRLANLQRRALSRYDSDGRRRRRYPGLDPARGVINGMIGGAVIWIVVILIAWWAWR